MAIVILKEKALLPRDKYIKLIDQTATYEQGMDALLVGLGIDESNSNAGIKIKKTVKLLNNYLCNPSDDYLRLEEASNSGDSGGAAFLKDENGNLRQIGVMSSMTIGFMGMCYGSNIIDLRIYIDWIEEMSSYRSDRTTLEITNGLKAKRLI